MKRFIGLVFAVVGGAVTLWSAASMLTGSSESRLVLGDVSVNAMVGGLISLATFTVGLVWVRD